MAKKSTSKSKSASKVKIKGRLEKTKNKPAKMSNKMIAINVSYNTSRKGTW